MSNYDERSSEVVRESVLYSDTWTTVGRPSVIENGQTEIKDTLKVDEVNLSMENGESKYPAPNKSERENEVSKIVDPSLHWNPNIERRGLGDSVIRMNHVALIVADVGISASFYSDIIGLQQIRRPDFDRHGAWFTMGNCELHLIKGIPLVHDGTHLIVCHISLEVKDTSQVLRKLLEFGIPFEQNISVPKGTGKAASEGGSEDNTLTQFFLRDPSGYYIELCNCGILTDFCLKNADIDINEYNEGIGHNKHHFITIPMIVKLKCLAMRARRNLNSLDLRSKHDTIIESAVPATEHNPALLKHFMKRQLIYGDIVQAFTEDEVSCILLQSGNHAPTAILIMRRLVEEGRHSLHYQPPAYYQFNFNVVEDGNVYRPRPLSVTERLPSYRVTNLDSSTIIPFQKQQLPRSSNSNSDSTSNSGIASSDNTSVLLPYSTTTTASTTTAAENGTSDKDSEVPPPRPKNGKMLHGMNKRLTRMYQRIRHGKSNLENKDTPPLTPSTSPTHQNSIDSSEQLSSTSISTSTSVQ